MELARRSFHWFAAAALLSTLASNSSAQHERFKLLPSDGEEGSYFGRGCDVSGNRAVIGALQGGTITTSGAAYLFDVTTGEQLLKLESPQSAPGNRFGESVAIDGDRVLVGARHENGAVAASGTAHLFNAVTGAHLRRIYPQDGEWNDSFGFCVSIEGSRAVISSLFDGDLGSHAGSAYVFDVDTGEQLFKLLPSDGTGGEQFGYSVSLSGDRVVIGAVYSRTGGVTTGAAYVFDVTTGLELFKLSPTGGEHLEQCGESVSLDGKHAVVGSPYAATLGAGSGTARVFDVTTGLQLFQLLPSNGGPQDHFGVGVAIDGTHIVVSAPHHELPAPSARYGALYQFDALTGHEHGMLFTSAAQPSPAIGLNVAIAGPAILAGDANDDVNGPYSGSAYVFAWEGVGQAYCLGDPGSGTPCPCGNDNDGAVPGSGCDNGVASSGAHLEAVGPPRVSDDSLVLVTSGLEPFNTGLYFQADHQVNGGDGYAFGDGLRCAGGAVIRLQIRTADASGVSSTTIPLAAKGSVTAGDTKRYQCWYRTVVNPPCGHGLSDFNLSNGYQLTWLP